MALLNNIKQWKLFKMTADDVNSWANGLLIFSLILGVLSTYAIVASSKIKEMALSQEMAASNARAAEANARAAEATLALEKIKVQIAPRRISGDQVTKMAAVLSAAQPVPIVIVSRLFDPEGKDFTSDIASVFQNSHWIQQSRFENWTASDKGLFIATVQGTLTPPPTSLTAAFDAAKIEYKIITIEDKDKQNMSPWFQPNVLYILVGAKP